VLNKGPPSLGHHCLEQSQTVVTLADRADFQEKNQSHAVMMICRTNQEQIFLAFKKAKPFCNALG
jgi:hypothetical protein